MSKRAKIAIATGDPAGIGPEISLKAALNPAVRNACRPIVVSDIGVIERHARACGLEPAIRAIGRVGDADWSNDCVNVPDCAQPDLAALDFGTTAAASGHASLAFADIAIKAALAGEVDAVVAAPQNETSIARAGITFDGYPSFVARVTGTDEDNVYLMLCFGDTKIVHTTLHRNVHDAIAVTTH
jgi:4-hydroxy-L-threonine phosphate dehydrogenase PdxA